MGEFPATVVIEYNSDLTIANCTLSYIKFLHEIYANAWLSEGVWIISQKDSQYIVIYPNELGNSESIMMSINPMTGTVHDNTWAGRL